MAHNKDNAIRFLTVTLLSLTLIGGISPLQLFSPNTSVAQAAVSGIAVKQWVKNYGGSEADHLNSVTKTADGGIVAVGYSSSINGDLPGNKGNHDFVIAKFDTAGNKSWVKNYGGTGSDRLTSVIQSSDGGLVAVGYSSSINGDLATNRGSSDFVIMKLDAAGNKVWINSFGGPGIDHLNSVIQTADGGFLAVGDSGSATGDIPGNKGGIDFIIAKFGPWGSKEWVKSYGGSGDDALTSVIQSSDGTFVAVGNSNSVNGDLSGNKGSTDSVMAKINLSGDKIWIKNYGGAGTDYLNSLVQASDGTFIAVGYSNSSSGDLPGNKGNNDFTIARIDTLGQKLWMKNYGGSDTDYLNSVALALDGDFIAVGNSNSNNGDISGNRGMYDFQMMKFDINGTAQWINGYGGTNNDQLNSVTQITHESFIAVGNSSSNNGDLPGNRGNSDFTIAKISEQKDLAFASVKIGNQKWTSGKLKPKLTVTLGGKTLVAGTDFTYNFSNTSKVGSSTATIVGRGNYYGSRTASFKIVPASIKTASVKIYDEQSRRLKSSNPLAKWTGKQLKPTFSVTVAGVTLKAGTDFSFSYGANKKVGKGTIKIVGKGNYANSKTASFQIRPKTVQLRKVTAGAKKITVSWNKAPRAEEVTKYLVEYCPTSKGKCKSKTVKATQSSLTITKLTVGKKYRARVKVIKGAYSSGYSKAKTSAEVKAVVKTGTRKTVSSKAKSPKTVSGRKIAGRD